MDAVILEVDLESNVYALNMDPVFVEALKRRSPVQRMMHCFIL